MDVCDFDMSVDKGPELFPAILRMLAKESSMSIVQIGAYIGNSDTDPLFNFLRKLGARKNVKVILVEPIREYFDLLCENYRDVPNIEFENVAIAETAGIAEMYRLNVDPVEHGYDEWLAQLSSLKKDRMEKLWDGYEGLHQGSQKKQFYLKHRVVEKVTCMTLHQLFDKHQIQQLDLLLIDAEGYDFEILRTLDFDKLKPEFINYERVLLQDDEPACRKLLESQGYVLIDWGQDTLCIERERATFSFC